ACSKSDTTSLTEPSGSASAPISASAGTTISGTVLTGTSSARSAASSPQRAGVPATVSIVGTSISATIDGSGRFTLMNIPTGDLTLAFSGNGTDARLTVTGVRMNDRIRITVMVNGNAADLDEDERDMDNDEAEVEGRVTATNCGASPQTIIVGTMSPTTVN